MTKGKLLYKMYSIIPFVLKIKSYISTYICIEIYKTTIYIGGVLKKQNKKKKTQFNPLGIKYPL